MVTGNHFLYCSPRLFTWSSRLKGGRQANKNSLIILKKETGKGENVPGSKRCQCTPLSTCWWVFQLHALTWCPPSSSEAAPGPGGQVFKLFYRKVKKKNWQNCSPGWNQGCFEAWHSTSDCDWAPP